MGTFFGGGFAVALVIGGLVLTVAWIVLPFAMIGTKGLLRQILQSNLDNQRLLEQLLEETRVANGERRPQVWSAKD